MKYILTTLLGISLFAKLPAQRVATIEQAKWLIGTWENNMGKSTLYETWTALSGTELVGKSYMLKNKDTMVFEHIRVLQEGGKLFYIPTVKNQNKGLPVRFVLTKNNGKELVFENTEHDFPQVIKYKRLSADSLLATVSGKKGGKERVDSFPMRRQQLD